MARRYLIVSDLHLADIENHPDGWKRYKSTQSLFDDELDALLARFQSDSESGEELTLILNGDIIDFDLVTAAPTEKLFPVTPVERKHGLRATEEKSVWKVRQVLRDHPGFISTLARFMGAGHQIVYIAGNHDPEIFFPQVRTAIRDAIIEAAEKEGVPWTDDRLIFEPWFYCVPGEIYAEHGHQYDFYSSFRYVLSPTISKDDPPTLAIPMGNLANRHMMSQMGFFNPHSTTYILNILSYVAHWLRYYAFSKRSLISTWFFGSFFVLAKLLRTKRKLLSSPPEYPALLEAQAAKYGLSPDKVRALDALKMLPITSRVYRIIREFWLDRVLLATVLTGSTITLALVPIPLWIKLMLPLSTFPLLWVVYEYFAHAETVFSVEKEVHKYAHEVAKIVPTKLVTFGHTHDPCIIPLATGVSYVNTGTWAPVFQSPSSNDLKLGFRNALFVTIENGKARLNLETYLPKGKAIPESSLHAQETPPSQVEDSEQSASNPA